MGFCLHPKCRTAAPVPIFREALPLIATTLHEFVLTLALTCVLSMNPEMVGRTPHPCPPHEPQDCTVDFLQLVKIEVQGFKARITPCGGPPVQFQTTTRITKPTVKAGKIQMAAAFPPLPSSRANQPTNNLFLRSVFLAQLGGEQLDFRQVTLHFAPAIPKRIVGIGMERPLEGTHPVFEVHDE